MKRLKIIILLVIAGLLASCGTIEIGIEATPTLLPQAASPTATQPLPSEAVSATLTPTLVSTATLTLPPSSPLAGLVYRSGDSLYQLGPDDQPQALAPGLDPQVLPGQFTPRAAVSPDGALLVSWWDFSDLWLVDLRTGKVTNLTNTPDRVECCAQFWPARPGTIVFMSQPADNLGQSIGYPTLINLDGSGYQVLDESSASLGLPAPAPDGQTIAYDRAGEAWLYRGAKSLEPLNPAGYGLQDPTGDLKLASPAWSPDGKLLAWIASGKIGPKGESVFTQAIFNLASKTHFLLAATHAAGGEGWPAAPVWSSDGAWLAFPDFSSDQFGMWVAKSDGTQAKRIYQPATLRGTSGLTAWWSPRAAQLLVIDPNAEGGTRILLVDPASGQSQPVPLPTAAVPVGWPQR
jgi:Tol biopolymer transport system component